MALVASFVLSPDEKHTFGKGLIPGGILVAVIGVFRVMPEGPSAGLGTMAFGIGLALFGLFWKKKYCPRCREGQCEVPQNHDLSGPSHKGD